MKAFFDINNIIFVEVGLMRMVDGDPSVRDDTSQDVTFRECARLVDACIWHSTERPGVIKVCVPPILSFGA